MRHTSKASSAGSNLGRRPRRHSFGALATFLLVLVALAGFTASSAFALETRPRIESFGPDGTAGSSFEFPAALALDQGNKRLYALDQATESINGFDVSSPGTHTPLGGNFPLLIPGSTELLDLSVDTASHQIFHTSIETGLLSGFDSSGTALGGNFPLSGGFCGVDVDAAGHIWAANAGTVEEYDSAGNQLSSFDASADGFPCDVAVDSQDNVYVSDIFGAIWQYSAASGYTSSTEVDPSSSGSLLYSAIAVDRASDDLYVAHANHISVYDSSGAPLYEFGDNVSSANYTGIAVDQATDWLYASDLGNAKIQVFGPSVPLPSVFTEDATDVTDTAATLHGTVNPEGKQLTGCSFEYGTTSAYGESAACVPAAASIPADSTAHAVKADLSGLTPGMTYHFRLVAETSEGTAHASDRVLLTASGPPTIGSESVEAVGTADATLSATLNPKGAATTFHVEYGTTAAYGQSSAESAPIGIGGDSSNHTVSVHISGLTPGTAYHFRFVATSPTGGAQGADGTFATYPTEVAFQPCANDQLRTGFGAHLPDCRAYEQVTPVDKHGANVQGTFQDIQASSDGRRIDFYVLGGLPTSGGGSGQAAFLASRGPGGWSADGLEPATDSIHSGGVYGWGESMATTLVNAPAPGGSGEAIYLRDSATGALQLGPVSSERFEGAHPAGFAADPSHLIFENQLSLLPGVPAGNSSTLYDLDHGSLTLVGRIPVFPATSCDDESGPACVPAPEGSFAGPYKYIEGDLKHGGATQRHYTRNAISRDGRRAFFTAGGSGRLYVREDGVRTTQVSASQRATPDPNGEKPAAWMASSADGSMVFFLSCEKLTDDSTAFSTAEKKCGNSEGDDLYSYDVDTHQLTDLTVDTNSGDAKGAAVQGVLGASDDGAYVYFAANGVLAPGASTGSCLIEFNFGTCNLYVAHDGVTKFIAQLSGRDDDRNWAPLRPNGGHLEPGRQSRVAPDGSAAVFSSVESLTGYDNVTHATNGCTGNGGPNERCAELFRYSAAEDRLDCVSCNPTAVTPSGRASLATEHSFFHNPISSIFLTRNISSDGDRVFLESPDALLPTDTNGVTDVYEWEAKGSGSCESESQNGGCLYLISSGASPTPSYFADASANGEHAFIFTGQQLVPSDRDELVDIYDAGVGVGLAAQHALAPPTCTAAACQANPAPPPDQTMSSASFSGPGNAHEPPKARKCPKGKRKVRRAGRVSCQKAHKQHKRHSNRGGSK